MVRKISKSTFCVEVSHNLSDALEYSDSFNTITKRQGILEFEITQLNSKIVQKIAFPKK